MKIHSIVKIIFTFVMLVETAHASQQILDPGMYRSPMGLLRSKQEHRLLETSLPLMTQNEFNQFADSLNLEADERTWYLQMTKNTYEDEHFVLNVQTKGFFNIHNTRSVKLLELNDATTNPFFTRENNIFADESYIGAGANLYAEMFGIFSANIQPYFLGHDGSSDHAFLKEVYGSIHINKLSVDIGKARLHWGYGAYEPIVFGDDYKPFFMIRMRNNEEIEFDKVLSFLGKIKFEMFYGWLDEYRDFPNGYIFGSTFSFQPTPRFHFHLTQSVLFGGDGAPTDNPFVIFWENFTNSTINPSNRNTTFGFRYRIPKIEIEPYIDLYVEDCCGTPPVNPRDILQLAGIYIPPMGKNKKFDMAFEWIRTNYITYRHDWYIYTQGRKILGHSIGPDANGMYAVTRYFHSRNWQLENLLAYEIRGREGRALSNVGFVPINVFEPTYQNAEQRFRFEQFVNYLPTPAWKWTVHAGFERIYTSDYQSGNDRWQGLFGLESSYNF